MSDDTDKSTNVDDQAKPDPRVPDPDYLKECVSIFPEQIQEEYVRLPADLAYWNARYAEAQKELMIAKVELDILERELYPVVRQELESGGQRVTEKMIESGIGQSSLWTDAKRRVANAEGEKAKHYGTLDAVRTKRDMLVSLGAHIRAEMQHDPTLRDHSRHVTEKMGFGGR